MYVSEMENSNNDLVQKLKDTESLRSDEASKRESMEKELAKLRSKYQAIFDDNEALKVEVQRGIEDIAKVLSEGYDRCLKRVSAAGFDVTGNSFDNYVKDYIASNPGGN